ncbi:MAG: MBOAT family protein [Gammaproteobacteria bacterium]|nr:MBOAT family protein [Gammaproteobacteria bacterium]MBI5615225.1 MBOAT family protein [Gammaproteobacteria bacterium]
MLFPTQPFLLLFLPLTLALYYACASSRRATIAALFAASLVFYSWWDPRFMPLLLASTVANWAIARWYCLRRRDWLITAGVAANLALLGAFKYANFFAASAAGLAGTTHERWDLILPLGISFFTFQQVSFLVDMRRDDAPRYSLLDYCTYVTFFAHLIAGPIVRHDELLGQFAAPVRRAATAENLGRGLLLLVLGLVKKVFIADELAPFADEGFAAAAATSPDALSAWTAALAYSLQLYFDFSSYSDMAMGLAAMFGFKFPLNFDVPYRALSIQEFWRRWHMTLSRFFRDYVYIPLGGNRGGMTATNARLMGTMLLCGLWHGAGWTFVAWGGLHGLALCVHRLWTARGLKLPAPLAWALTMLFVVVGWVLFRAESFGVAAHLLRGMAGCGGPAAAVESDTLMAISLAAVLAVIPLTNIRLAERQGLDRPWTAALVGLALVLVALRVGEGRSLDFIYFQF